MTEPGWADRPGVYSLAAPASAESVRYAAAVSGITVYAVPPVASKAEFLDALVAALDFPPWFGRNWDAAADLLADPVSLPAGRWVLLWIDPERLRVDDPDAYQMAADILVAAAADGRLTVLLVDS